MTGAPRKLDPAIDGPKAQSMAGYGLTTKQIADVLGVSERTVERHLLSYIQQGRSQAIAKVAQQAYRMALEGKPPAMTMFWLKTQARWRETDHPDDGKQQDPKPLAIE